MAVKRSRWIWSSPWVDGCVNVKSFGLLQALGDRLTCQLGDKLSLRDDDGSSEHLSQGENLWRATPNFLNEGIPDLLSKVEVEYVAHRSLHHRLLGEHPARSSESQLVSQLWGSIHRSGGGIKQTIAISNRCYRLESRPQIAGHVVSVCQFVKRMVVEKNLMADVFIHHGYRSISNFI